MRRFCAWALGPLVAALALIMLPAAAQAACTSYTGNTKGTDSAAIVSHLKQLCDKTEAGAGRSQPFPETTTPLGISGSFIGATARDAGSGTSPWAWYVATFIPDQAGTASILCSNDSFTTTYTCATSAVAAGTAVTLRYPVTFRYFKPKLVNGGTAQTSLVVTSAFLAGD